jgi:crotonobetainyl-CoA:carnitine CoA-transferase CaiB-like acyl-CoA transferase
MEPARQQALSGVRVIEVVHPYGQYCGKLLADLGADVIKIEPPGGDEARRIGPFHDGASLHFAYYNSNKRSLALDLTSAEGQEAFRQLVRDADAVVYTPDHLRIPGLEVTYEALKALNPKLVVAAISGFAAGGPYSGFRSTPLVTFALSGIMKNIGPPEGPPEPAPGQIAFDLAAVDAANGIVCALLSGQGQQVTVAAHEVLASEINPRAPEQFDDRRHPRSANPQLAPSGAFKCLDGQVTFFINLPNHWQGLKELLGNPPEIAGPEWDDRTYRSQHAVFLADLVEQRLAGRRQADIVAEGQRLRVPCGPINTVETFAHDPHVRSREFFVEAGGLRMPGAPYKLSEGGWAIRRAAPLLGEASKGWGEGSPSIRGRDARATKQGQALAGLRAVAFTTAFAGPTVGRYLADLGAEVIKVESRRRWDNTRHASSAGVASMTEPNGAPTAPGFGYFNRNQLGVAIDLSQDKGRELMLRLIAKTDVVIENFSFQVLQKWGFTYDKLKDVKPDIIMLDMQGFGQSGPFRDYLSFGSVIHSYSGLASLWGSAHGFFVDYIAAQHAVLAVLSALTHRRRTGHSVHIDLAQLETAGAMLGVPYMDYFANGYVTGYQDERLLRDAPTGCYRCKGEDGWCVVEVTGDADWRRLREAMGSPGWAQDRLFDTTAGRLANRAALDEGVASWTERHGDREVQELLQAAEVPAAAVVASRDVFTDPQLEATGFYQTIDHTALGPWKYPRLPLHLSAFPDGPARPAPMMGEHNGYVFGELLGLSSGEIERLTEEGVLT